MMSCSVRTEEKEHRRREKEPPADRSGPRRSPGRSRSPGLTLRLGDGDAPNAPIPSPHTCKAPGCPPMVAPARPRRDRAVLRRESSPSLPTVIPRPDPGPDPATPPSTNSLDEPPPASTPSPLLPPCPPLPPPRSSLFPVASPRPSGNGGCNTSATSEADAPLRPLCTPSAEFCRSSRTAKLPAARPAASNIRLALANGRPTGTRHAPPTPGARAISREAAARCQRSAPRRGPARRVARFRAGMRRRRRRRRARVEARAGNHHARMVHVCGSKTGIGRPCAARHDSGVGALPRCADSATAGSGGGRGERT